MSNQEMLDLGYSIVTHAQLKVGDVVPEADGFLLNVTKTRDIDDDYVEITYQSDFSSHKAIQEGKPFKVLKDELVFAKSTT